MTPVMAHKVMVAGPPGTWSLNSSPGYGLRCSEIRNHNQQDSSYMQQQNQQQQHPAPHGAADWSISLSEASSLGLFNNHCFPPPHAAAPALTAPAPPRVVPPSYYPAETYADTDAELDGASDNTPKHLRDGRRPASLSQVLQALQEENAPAVLTVRRIHALGFSAAYQLKEYFSQFGPVKVVLLPRSGVKASPGRKAHARPSSIGFVVMRSVDSAHVALSWSEPHYINGVIVTLSPFEGRGTAEGSSESRDTNDSEESTTALSTPRGGGSLTVSSQPEADSLGGRAQSEQSLPTMEEAEEGHFHRRRSWADLFEEEEERVLGQSQSSGSGSGDDDNYEHETATRTSTLASEETVSEDTTPPCSSAGGTFCEESPVPTMVEPWDPQEFSKDGVLTACQQQAAGFQFERLLDAIVSSTYASNQRLSKTTPKAKLSGDQSRTRRRKRFAAGAKPSMDE